MYALRPVVSLAAVAAVSLSACKPPAEIETAPPADAPPEAALEAASASAEIPPFADFYPEATLSGPVLRADGPAGPGGMAQFTTEAAPDAVVEFYRQRAEAAGLISASTMNQGEARGYKAASPDGAVSLDVVAGPVEGVTAVQLSWTNGRG